MASLRFLHSVMGSGKSTLLVGTAFNYRQRGAGVLVLTINDRNIDGDSGTIESRSGLTAEATQICDTSDLYALVADRLRHENLNYILVDEAQFLTPTQVEQLAAVVDRLNIDVTCFGLLTDFRSELFEGSKRLIELSDEISELHTAPLCSCGTRAMINARLIDGEVVIDGDVVVVGDVTDSHDVRYETMCRRCFMDTHTKLTSDSPGEFAADTEAA